MKNNTFKNSQDFRKSLEVRLQRTAKEKGIDLQRIRRQVAFDRLLARFFNQPETPFFLKGGYAMELRLSTARATKDIDLTYLQRVKSKDDSLSALILNDLQQLAALDLGDYFSFALGEALLDLDNAPYGGARYPVSSFIDGKLFVRFHLDVGGDVLDQSNAICMVFKIVQSQQSSLLAIDDSSLGLWQDFQTPPMKILINHINNLIC